jgi:hypothetical protein
MSGSLPITRRTILSAMAYLSLKPTAGLADEEPSQAGEPWEPEAIREKIWLEWRIEDVPAGPVAGWSDRAGGVVAEQPDEARQPIKLPSGEIDFADDASSLIIPYQSRAYEAHRAVVCVFKGDVTVRVNGDRRPQPGIESSDGAVEVAWATPADPNSLTFDVSPGWHCLVSRRVGGVHYASLDGSPEIATGQNICVPRFRGNQPVGLVRGEIDYLSVVQNEMSESEAQKFMAWACRRRGIPLPDGHPYSRTPPLTGPEDWKSTFVESSEQEWDELALMRGEGNLDLSGYEVVFEDHFEEMTITDEWAGTGPWYAPVHGSGTGKAKHGFVDSDPPVYIQRDSELIIRMRPEPGADFYRSGIFCSVNQNGHGNTWEPPFYIEWRLRNTRGNGYGSWPAVWVKSVNEYFMMTESRVEIDAWEGWNSRPTEFYMAYHNHDALRHWPGRIASHRSFGGHTNPADLYDDSYHRYGLMIDEEFVRYFFDGEEQGRIPAPIEVYQPMFILVDLALPKAELDQVEGEYEMGVDYIRVFRRV